MSQVSHFTDPDYFTDEQLANAKAIRLRNNIYQNEKPSSLPDQLSYQWCSTSLNFLTDLTDNYQKVTRADIQKYIDTYIKNKPFVAGMVIKPELNKQINAAAFFNNNQQ